jgi:hypothetical protein
MDSFNTKKGKEIHLSTSNPIQLGLLIENTKGTQKSEIHDHDGQYVVW